MGTLGKVTGLLAPRLEPYTCRAACEGLRSHAPPPSRNSNRLWRERLYRHPERQSPSKVTGPSSLNVPIHVPAQAPRRPPQGALRARTHTAQLGSNRRSGLIFFFNAQVVRTFPDGLTYCLNTTGDRTLYSDASGFCADCPLRGVLLQTSAWPPSSLSGLGLDVTSSEQPLLAPLGQGAGQRPRTLLRDTRPPDVVLTCLLIPVIARTRSFHAHCGVPGAWDGGPAQRALTGTQGTNAASRPTLRGGLRAACAVDCLSKDGDLVSHPCIPFPPTVPKAQQGPVAVGSAPTAVTKGLFWASVNIFSGPLSSAPSQETQFTLPPTRGPQEPHRDLMLRVPASLSQVPFQQPLLGQGPRLAI